MTPLSAPDSFDFPPLPAAPVAPFGAATTSVNIAELKRKSVPELQEMAESYAIDDRWPLQTGSHLKIEQKPLDQSVTLTGEGVLEILPEGYGFLRSRD